MEINLFWDSPKQKTTNAKAPQKAEHADSFHIQKDMLHCHQYWDIPPKGIMVWSCFSRS